MRERPIQERMNREFLKELKEVNKTRVKKDLEDKTLPIHEITRMIINADAWLPLKEELVSKPRRRRR